MIPTAPVSDSRPVPKARKVQFPQRGRRLADSGGLMGTAVTITQTDHAAADLRAFAAKCPDAAQSRRLLAIAMVLDGSSRLEAARQTGMDRQTLRDWVHRYNETGVAGLLSRLAPGPTPKLTVAQMAELRELVIAGPNPQKHQVVRWRCVDLCAEVARRFSVTVPERTMGKWLRKLKLTRLQPRPFHPKKDAAAQEAFKTNFSSILKEALLSTTAGTPVEIWFQDEARVGQKGSHAYVWAPVGSRPPIGTGQPSRQRIPVRRDLPRARRRRRGDHARRQHRVHEPASEGNQHTGYFWRPRSVDLRRRRLASARWRARTT